MNPDGTRDTSFTRLTLNDEVYAVIPVENGKHLVAGAFTDVGGNTAIVNFNAAFTWSGKGTNGATVTISKAGKVTVKGLTTGKRSRVTITSIRTGYSVDTNAVTRQAQ